MLSDESGRIRRAVRHTRRTDDDPHVWGWLKGVKHFFSSGKVEPVDARPADVSAGAGPLPIASITRPICAAAGYQTANTKSGKFAVFPTLDEGVLAAAKQLQIYGTRGVDNIHDIVGKWAPPKENNTRAYIDHVTKATGRSEFEKLNLNDPKVLAQLISTMSVKEGWGIASVRKSHPDNQ